MRETNRIWRLTLLLLSLSLGHTVFIHREIESQQEVCLWDDIPRHTLIKIDLKASGDFQFTFKEGMIPSARVEVNRIAFTKSFTTQKYGIHHFCFQNLGERASIAFQVTIGHRAKDYGSTAGGDELLGSLRNQGSIAEQFIGEIVKENSEGMEIIVRDARQTHDFQQYSYFTVVFALLSLLVSYLQFRVIKKHLHQRKYI